ncbi:lasso RiPP family leader peptide-containing protein [Streptomyces eurythermus]|uniref:lasso RiPP family leader peptide-containing protein n=1 Tax=Streptomyces eurythermus TaxID=42237 RepID=UPI0036F66F26
MENREGVYEAPTLSEAGDFAEVTLGWPFGHRRTAVSRRTGCTPTAREPGAVNPVGARDAGAHRARGRLTCP